MAVACSGTTPFQTPLCLLVRYNIFVLGNPWHSSIPLGIYVCRPRRTENSAITEANAPAKGTLLNGGETAVWMWIVLHSAATLKNWCHSYCNIFSQSNTSQHKIDQINYLCCIRKSGLYTHILKCLWEMQIYCFQHIPAYIPCKYNFLKIFIAIIFKKARSHKREQNVFKKTLLSCFSFFVSFLIKTKIQLIATVFTFKEFQWNQKKIQLPATTTQASSPTFLISVLLPGPECPLSAERFWWL